MKNKISICKEDTCIHLIGDNANVIFTAASVVVLLALAITSAKR